MINVRFFASLAERLGRTTATVAFQSGMSAGDAWRIVTGSPAPPAGILTAINKEYADPSTAIADGDEVAFFPPVTGG